MLNGLVMLTLQVMINVMIDQLRLKVVNIEISKLDLKFHLSQGLKFRVQFQDRQNLTDKFLSHFSLPLV